MSYPETPQTPYTPPPRKSSLTWLWILLAVVVVLMLLCAGLCVGLGYWGVRAATGVSELHNEALERAQQSPEVQERLGTPIQGGPPEFEFNQQAGGLGAAQFSFEVSGSEGEATVRAEGERTNGDWTFTVLEVTFDDDTVIDLKEQRDLK